jgi:CheY-like chemotaxis protein
VGEAADAVGLLQAVRKQAPDLLLLDWELPGLEAEYLLHLLR